LPEKSPKPFILRLQNRSGLLSLVKIEKGLLNFRVVINNNIRPISHNFGDMAIYWLKVANFLYPL